MPIQSPAVDLAAREALGSPFQSFDAPGAGQVFSALGGPVVDVPAAAGAQMTTTTELPGGGYAVSWIAIDPRFGPGDHVFIQRYDNSMSPVGDLTVVEPAANALGTAYITALADGSIVVVSNEAGGIYAQVVGADGTLQTPTPLHVDFSFGGGSFNPTVAATQDGGFTVLFTNSEHSGDVFSTSTPDGTRTQTVQRGWDAYAQSYHLSHGQWTADTGQNIDMAKDGFFTAGQDQGTQDDGFDQYGEVHLAALSGGGSVAVYRDVHWYAGSDAGGPAWASANQVSARILDADGRPTGPEIDIEDDFSNGDSASYPYDVGVAAVGTGFAAMYAESVRASPSSPYVANLYFKLYDQSGGQIGGPVAFATQIDIGGNSYLPSFPRACALPDGKGFAIVWQQNYDGVGEVTGSGQNLFIAAFDMAGNVISGPTLISGDVAGGSGELDPRAYGIQLTADGAVEVTFQEFGSGSRVIATREFVFADAGAVTDHGDDGRDAPKLTTRGDWYSGLGGDDAIRGLGGDDHLFGGSGDDVLQGGAGNDLLDGGDGIDTASYAKAGAAVSVNLSIAGAQPTGEGSDTLVGIENLTGSGSDDRLTGDAGANRLSGGGGADTLTGGRRADVLIGGGGVDVFMFGAVADSTASLHDTITDLTNADHIDLGGIDANTTKGGDQAFHLVSAFSGHAGELTVAYDSKHDRTVISGDVDGDGKADLVIWASGDQHGFTNFVL